MEIHFSRRHPIEAPTIMFPVTQQNRRNLSHPLVDSNGEMFLINSLYQYFNYGASSYSRAVSPTFTSPLFPFSFADYRTYSGRFHLELVRPDKWMCVTSVLDIVRNLREVLNSSPALDVRSRMEKIAHVQVRFEGSNISEDAGMFIFSQKFYRLCMQ